MKDKGTGLGPAWPASNHHLMKRKREELDDSDEDEPAYGKQILPVANLPQGFNEEPADGMQYLFTVRYVHIFIYHNSSLFTFISRRDARQLPDVVRVSNPYEEPEPRSVAATAINPIIQSCLPSEEWRELFEFRFQNFRKVCYLDYTSLPDLHTIFVEPRSTNNTCWTSKLCWGSGDARQERTRYVVGFPGWEAWIRLESTEESQKTKH